ncbi:MAG: G1 family glutamic endopeptidase [Acidimicrobiales bacterium]
MTGDWTVPGVTCTGTRSTYSSVWIGIDGDVSSTVEQDGTEADCINGTPSYDAWYELYGDNSQNDGSEIELSTTSYPVVPGDEMAAAVSETGSVWTFALSDTSTQHPDWSYTSGGIAFAAAQSSAEWIVERPELCGNSCSLTSLADFGTAGVSDATTTTSSLVHAPIDAFSSTDIQMTNSAGTKVLAQPSALGAGGTSFTDTWEAAG